MYNCIFYNQPYKYTKSTCLFCFHFPPQLMCLNSTENIYTINYKCLIQSVAHKAPQCREEYPTHLEKHILIYISCRKETEVDWSCILCMDAGTHEFEQRLCLRERQSPPSVCKSTEQLPKMLNPADSPPFRPLHNTQQEYTHWPQSVIFLAHPALGNVASGN